ncbi:Nn.00g061300.m01.CDS01 [Neocucurbitaria sp. VM-36]
MTLSRMGGAVASILFQSILVAAQMATGTSVIAATSLNQPPFPISSNSSSVATELVSSTVIVGTAITKSSNITTTRSTSSSDAKVPRPKTSTGSHLSSGTELTSTAMLSSVISGVATTLSVTNVSVNSSTVLHSSKGSNIDDSSSTGSSRRSLETFLSSSTSFETVPPPGITFMPSPSTTLLPIGTEIQSSASDLSTVIAGIFPLIQSFIDYPEPPEITAAINELDNILPKAIHFLGKLPKPTDGVEPCNSRKDRRSHPNRVAVPMSDKRSLLGGLFKTAFSLVTCIIDTTNKVKDGVMQGTTGAVRTVKELQDELKPMVDALREVDPNEKPEPSDTTSKKPRISQSDLSSSSSCTLQTVSNCEIGCTAVVIATSGGRNKRAQRDACTTACGPPITRCDATGITSVSTTTSTTTAYQRCAQDCTNCNASNRKLPTNAPDLRVYSKAANGVLYLPAPTVTTLDSDGPVAEARELRPKETSSHSSNFLRRGLTSPHDARYNGDVGTWLMVQVAVSLNDLAHGQPPLTTTGFSFSLDNEPNTWSLKDLYGCTSVIVISRKRMFMAHLWEDPSMITPHLLQTQVLDSLRNGDAGVPQGLTAFTGPGGDFENIPANKVRAFIITPYRRGSTNPSFDDLQFPYEVGKIKDLLSSILGRSDTSTIPYVPRDPDPDFLLPFGKVLLQYDPVAVWLGQANGGCNTQVAGIELWFENSPRYRYRDRWNVFPNQLLPVNSLPRRSISTKSRFIRLLRGREVTDADEKEWREFDILMQRQEGGSCLLPSRSNDASSTSPSSTGPSSSASPLSSTNSPSALVSLLSTSSSSSSIFRDSTTFQTSFLSLSGGGGGTIPAKESTSSTKESQTTKEESHSSTEESPPKKSTSSPAPTPTASKAVSIILRNVNDNGDDYNSWTFFETSVGSQTDGCSVPVLNDPATRWSDRDAIKNPPWPHGTFTMTLFGEDNCQYLNDGNGAGILHCPTMGEGNNVGCKEDSEKGRVSAITQCLYSLQLTRAYHRVVYCEY